MRSAKGRCRANKAARAPSPCTPPGRHRSSARRRAPPGPLEGPWVPLLMAVAYLALAGWFVGHGEDGFAVVAAVLGVVSGRIAWRIG